MPEITDPRLKAKILANAKPFDPTAAPTTGADGSVSFPMRQDRVLGQQQVATSIEGQETNTQKTRADFEAEERAREQTGGVNSNATEDRATGLYIPAATAAKRIFQILQKTPEATSPGFRETAGEFIADTFVPKPFENWVKNKAIPEDVREARSAMRPLYKALTQNALYFASGAQAPIPEEDKFIEQVQPAFGDTKSQIAVKKEQILARLQGMKVGAGGRAAQIDELMETIGSAYDAWVDPDATVQGEVDPTGKGNSKEIPASAVPAILASIRSSGVKPGDLTPEIFTKMAEEVLAPYGMGVDPESTKSWVSYYNRAGKRLPLQELSLEIAPPKEELDNEGRAAARISASAPGVAGANFANAMTLGAVEAATGPERFDSMNRYRPNSAAVGDIAGSIAPTMLGERGVAKGLELTNNFPKLVERVEKALGPKAARRLSDPRSRELVGDLTANIGYEGVRAGVDDDRTVGEGMFSGGTSALGGRLAQKGVAGFRDTPTQKNFDLLQGTDLTVPQRIGLGKTEEILSDFPIVKGNRNAAIEGSNRTFAQKILSDIVPEAGQGPVKLSGTPRAGFDLAKATRVAIDAEYSKIRPKVVGNLDQEFLTKSTVIGSAVPAGEAAKWYKQEILPIGKILSDANGHYDGNSMKAAMRKLWQLEDNLQTKIENGSAEPWAYDMIRTIGNLRTEIRGVVTRNNPEVAERLFSIDNAYARYIRLRDATVRAKRSGGVFSPTQLQDSIVKLDPSMGKRASSEGRALDQDFAQAGMEVMGSKGPSESGSFWKILAAGGILGNEYASEAVKPLLAVAGAVGLTSYIPKLNRVTKYLVDGKRPTTADSVLMMKLVKHPKARELIDDGTRALITQYLANRTGERTPGDK